MASVERGLHFRGLALCLRLSRRGSGQRRGGVFGGLLIEGRLFGQRLLFGLQPISFLLRGLASRLQRRELGIGGLGGRRCSRCLCTQGRQLALRVAQFVAQRLDLSAGRRQSLSEAIKVPAEVASLLLGPFGAIFERVGPLDGGRSARLGTLRSGAFDSNLVGHRQAYEPARTASIAAVQRSSREESLTVAST